MKEERFMALLFAYGAELSRWPADELPAAEALLAGANHRLRDIWESERAFDRLLACDTQERTSVFLEARILNQARRLVPANGSRATGSRTVGVAMKWAAGGALAASLALGFVAGYVTEADSSEGGYAHMLRMSGGGAGTVFLSALAGTEN